MFYLNANVVKRPIDNILLEWNNAVYY